MDCPKCWEKTGVIDSRPSNWLLAVHRRRECKTCGHRFNTIEIAEEWFRELNEAASKQTEEEAVDEDMDAEDSRTEL